MADQDLQVRGRGQSTPGPHPWIHHWILLGRGRRGTNSCKDNLGKQQRGKAGSWHRSGFAEYRILLKIEGKVDRTAMDR